MDTDALIKAMAADRARPPLGPRLAWGLACTLAVVVAAGVFFAALGPRPDIAAVAGTLRFLFKFLFTLTLAATAFVALRAMARPGAPVAGLGLLVAPLLLTVAVVSELLAVPPPDWGARMLGTNSMACLAFIPLIGLGPMGIFLAMLRHGAPTRPRLAGAVAGLLAGGLAATFYAAHCTDDSPLFVALWYSLAITVLAVLGTIAAPRIARW